VEIDMPLLPFDDIDEEQPLQPVQSIIDPLSTSPVYETSGHTENLIIDVEGEPWEVDYYNQVLTSGESPKPLDLGLDPTLQQYIHTLAFRISVTDELSTSNDATTGTTDVTGGGMIYPDTVIPHIGDMFVGKMDMGFSGVFTITSVSRATFYKRSAYQVEYRLYDQLDSELQDNLKLKSIDDKFFDKNRLIAGKSPIVSYGTANKEVLYRQNIARAVDILYENFYSDDQETLIYNVDSASHYDPVAIAFFNSVVDSRSRHGRPLPKEYNVGVEDLLNKPTIWRAILRSDSVGLDYLYPRLFLPVTTSSLNITYIQSSIVHSKIDYVTLPDKWKMFTVDSTLPSYVLSHAFYDGDVANQTLLEKAVISVIGKERVIDSVLNTLIDEISTKADRELFYHLLLLIAILTIRIHEG
jgi:hypothetical protein